MTLRIAFDVGGVLSKYPEIFRDLLGKLSNVRGIAVYILSDMHPKSEILDVLMRNRIVIAPSRVYSCDYKRYGENAKAKLCHDLKIDIMIDDFMAYLSTEGATIRLLVMPDPTKSYFADSWKNKPGADDFGRRTTALCDCPRVRSDKYHYCPQHGLIR